jgi:hypothetical protein
MHQNMRYETTLSCLETRGGGIQSFVQGPIQGLTEGAIVGYF